ncbi:hypothetical protein ACFV4N_29525 [Actinosynnema sp. NPDC059797]
MVDSLDGGPVLGVRRWSIELDEPDGDAVVLRVAGAVTYSKMTPLSSGFTRLLAVGANTVVVDLTRAYPLCSEAALALVLLASRCDGQGRGLRVVPSSVVRRKLAVLGLLDAIPLTAV